MVLIGGVYLAQRHGGAEFLDRIYRINRIKKGAGE